MFVRDYILYTSPELFWLVLSGFIFASGISFVLSLRWLYHGRLLADTPTARIRAAAQGYVELQGRARMMEGTPIVSPLSGQHCVWYHYVIEHKRENREMWQVVEKSTSQSVFFLDDDDHLCIVDPEGARVTASFTQRWRGQLRRPGTPPPEVEFWWERWLEAGPYRYTECRIHEGDPLYAIGQLVTLTTADPSTTNDEVRDVLSCWKRDRAGLLSRFDKDRDGQINQEEWETARQEAERQVMASWHEKAAIPEFPVLKKPTHGHPYILSTDTQETLITAYYRKALIAALLFLLLGAVATFAFTLRLSQ